MSDIINERNAADASCTVFQAISWFIVSDGHFLNDLKLIMYWGCWVKGYAWYGSQLTLGLMGVTENHSTRLVLKHSRLDFDWLMILLVRDIQPGHRSLDTEFHGSPSRTSKPSKGYWSRVNGLVESRVLAEWVLPLLSTSAS